MRAGLCRYLVNRSLETRLDSTLPVDLPGGGTPPPSPFHFFFLSLLLTSSSNGDEARPMVQWFGKRHRQCNLQLQPMHPTTPPTTYISAYEDLWDLAISTSTLRCDRHQNNDTDSRISVDSKRGVERYEKIRVCSRSLQPPHSYS